MAEHAASRDTPTRGRPTARPDLAAMLVPLCRALVDAERPVLDAHGLTMWAYAVLLRLDETPIRTQAALAEAIRADKTRIIPILDDLESRGLIHRRPDPGDRRVRLVSVTPEGRRLRDAVQADIQRGEEHLLADLPTADREGFLRGLLALHALPEIPPHRPSRDA
ncbi:MULTISPECIES: MarR family winged helix-turn-helix transcriptional regulator [unclassified Streptomyces]|uniref:MarR family winged helix-turn-helix transcriptional regulator n=1 Tax=unclassified Streptomyces TaxID=2593676 RepID=UPI000C27F933|nr:MarR family transcriptional regulator [Streptomyces sp. CB02959]PJN33693.1 MarR family transcriptional regulator [Streptomyces sp. CB02959]